MSAMAKPKTYTVTSTGCELPIGSRFSVKSGAVRSGQLALFQVGRILIVGRMFENFIVQPQRWIQTSPDVRLIGGVCDV